MDFQNFFPVWSKLTAAQQNLISGHLMSRTISKGTVIHNGSMDCTGLLLVKSMLPLWITVPLLIVRDIRRPEIRFCWAAVSLPQTGKKF